MILNLRRRGFELRVWNLNWSTDIEQIYRLHIIWCFSIHWFSIISLTYIKIRLSIKIHNTRLIIHIRMIILRLYIIYHRRIQRHPRQHILSNISLHKIFISYMSIFIMKLILYSFSSKLF